MTQQLLYAHWKASRWVLLPFVLLAFGLPMLVLRLAELIAADEYGGGATVIEASRAWMPLFPLLAFTTGFAIALAGWSWDHRGNHVYALSLPMRRSTYVLHKMAVGAVLLLIPAVAVWLSSYLGAAMNDLPEGIRIYPFGFGMRFLLATLLAYALAFALASGTIRTTVTIISAALLIVVFGTILVEYLGDALGTRNLITPLDVVVRALMTWPGPFNVFGGSWMLIDV